jgi:membrane-bound serine protease (ClpP class)
VNRKLLSLILGLGALAASELGASVPVLGAPSEADGTVYVLPYDGVITPVAADYLVGGLEDAQRQHADAVVIELDTPGGLDSSMRDIIKAMMASTVPVVVYVAPSGSRAASAGVFITMAAHVAAMAPGTNIGSASPVSLMGAQMDSTMARKVMHDAVAYLEGIAQQRGRSQEWARRFVEDADNIPAERALEENVIDFVAKSLPDLLEATEGRVVQLPQGERELHLAAATVVRHEMGLRHRVLATLANPTLAYMLLLLGIYGIFFELSNPGALLPGILGGIAILLALFAFQALPINYAGLGLILLAMVLFILEIHVASFGLLSIGGLAALVLGSLLLFDSPADWARLSWTVLVPAVGVTALYFGLCVWLAVRGQRRPVVTGVRAMIGERGRVVEAVGEGRHAGRCGPR